MHDPTRALLNRLLETPSPSGYGRPVQDVVREWAAPYADEVRTDRHGNVLAVRYPVDGAAGHEKGDCPPSSRGQSPFSCPAQRIMLAGHCDQIALMVQHIHDNGFLYVQPIGGGDMQVLLRQDLTAWTKHGPVAGRSSRRRAHPLPRGRATRSSSATQSWGAARCCSAARTSTRASSSACRTRPRRRRLRCRCAAPRAPPAPTPTPFSWPATAWRPA